MACYIAALLCLVITAGLLGLLCCQFIPALSRSRGRLDFSIYNQQALIVNDRAQLLAPLPSNCPLTVKNHADSPLTFIFSESQSFSLLPQETRELSLTSSDVFAVESGGQTTYYVSSADGLKKALQNDHYTLDNVVLLQDIALEEDLVFARSCRIDLGPYRITGEAALCLETQERVEVSILAQGENAVFFTAQAPNAKLYCTPKSLSYPLQTYDYYLKAHSINGSELHEDQYPIENEAMLTLLSEKGTLTPNSTLIFTRSFSLTRNHSFPFLPNLTFEKAVDFSNYKLSFESQLEAPITVITRESMDPAGLCLNAPLTPLTWKGGFIPDIQTLCLTSTVSSYNQQDTTPYRLGGQTQAKVIRMTVRHKDLIAPIEYTLQGNVFQGILHTLDAFSTLENAYLEVECDNGTFAIEANAQNPDGTVNLTQNPLCTLTDAQGNVARFSIQTKREYLDLPVIEIYTQNSTPVASKSEYVNATFDLIPNGADVEGINNATIQIRGRGNSTWKWEKKPFKLKFDTDVSLFGLAPSNEWALLSNYADKSLIRNRLAYEMAKLLSFDYTPSQYCVDLYLNGEYQGVYTIGEHLEAAPGRIELPYSADPAQTGYLIEVGGVDTAIHKKGVHYFHAGTIRFALVKTPGLDKITSLHFDYISQWLIQADKAIVEGGDWRQYLDEESLADWILFMELTNNTDCAFRRSCFFTKTPDSKLKMGPVWDFDLAFGNFNRDDPKYTSWATTTDDDYVGVTWTAYLLQDDAFVNTLYTRWQQIKEPLLKRSQEVIEESRATMQTSAKLNFQRWDVLNLRTMMQHSNVVRYNTFDKQLSYLTDFLTKRADWLSKELTRLHEGGEYEIPVIEKED